MFVGAWQPTSHLVGCSRPHTGGFCIIPRPPAAGRPGPGRPAAGRQGLIRKKKDDKKLQIGPWGPVARQRGGRPPTPI